MRSQEHVLQRLDEWYYGRFKGVWTKEFASELRADATSALRSQVNSPKRGFLEMLLRSKLRYSAALQSHKYVFSGQYADYERAIDDILSRTAANPRSVQAIADPDYMEALRRIISATFPMNSESELDDLLRSYAPVLETMAAGPATEYVAEALRQFDPKQQLVHAARKRFDDIFPAKLQDVDIDHVFKAAFGSAQEYITRSRRSGTLSSELFLYNKDRATPGQHQVRAFFDILGRIEMTVEERMFSDL